MNRPGVERAILALIQACGWDDDHNFEDTPRRYADVLEEMFTPKESGWPVFDEDYTDEVIIRGHTFHTMCPHHLLPVKIVASVGYIPRGKVIGASKLIRMIHEVNIRPMTQEKLTARIAQSIYNLTDATSAGEAVVLTGSHGCMEIRGVKSNGNMVTSKFTNGFDTPEMRERFFQIVRGTV